MNNDNAAIQWATDYLRSRHCKVIALEKAAEPAHSIVTKITTSQGIFYLKQTPPALFREPDTIALLQTHGCQQIPVVIAKNDYYHSFLTAACGDISLRELFSNGGIDMNVLEQGINHYLSIQRIVESDTLTLLNFGIPDWRLDQFPLLYRELIQETDCLVTDGLTRQEIASLHHAYDWCVEQCERLSSYHIPETINHCDFQENNMLLSKATGEVSIIDWGETVISHPFFSLNTCLWNLTYFHNLKQTDRQYRLLQQLCVSPWLDKHEERDLITAFNISNQLLGVFAALGYQFMYEATANQTKKVQEEHPGSIAGCLRSFLQQVNKG